jgi:hypothetical protein
LHISLIRIALVLTGGGKNPISCNLLLRKNYLILTIQQPNEAFSAFNKQLEFKLGYHISIEECEKLSERGQNFFFGAVYSCFGKKFETIIVYKRHFAYPLASCELNLNFNRLCLTNVKNIGIATKAKACMQKWTLKFENNWKNSFYAK